MPETDRAASEILQTTQKFITGQLQHIHSNAEDSKALLSLALQRLPSY